MMHRYWTKIIVAGLLLLGEGAVASAAGYQADDGRAQQSKSVSWSQLGVDKATGSQWQGAVAGAEPNSPRIIVTQLRYITETVLVSDGLLAHPYNPRAPPSLVSW